MGILDQAAPVGEVAPWVKMCVYGDPGVGKSTFCATAPAPLFLDVEKGTLVLKGKPEFKDVLVLQVQDYKTLEKVYWELKEGGLPEIKTVVLDTFTELQKRVLDGIVREQVLTNSLRKGNPYLPQLQDYGQNTHMLRRLLVAFCELDRHVIFTAHAIEAKDEEVLVWRPAITQKLWESVEGLMDVVGFLTVETDKDRNIRRQMQVQPSRRVKAKCRIAMPENPGIIENPTFQMFVDALERMNR